MTTCYPAVLVSNLGGATGFLLGLDGGKTASKLKIDSIFPVRGLKRCIKHCWTSHAAFAEFQYPGDWLADRNMYARRAQRIESRNSLDPMAPSRYRLNPLSLYCCKLTGVLAYF